MSQKKGSFDPTFPYHLPATRIAAILRDAAAAAGLPLDDTDNRGGLEYLAHRTGFKARTLYRILKQEGPTVSFDTADRILCRLGQVDLWRLPPEQGGLADYYLATEENPAPALPEMTAEQRSFADKHNKRRAEGVRRRRAELEKARRAWPRKSTAVPA